MLVLLVAMTTFNLQALDFSVDNLTYTTSNSSDVIVTGLTNSAKGTSNLSLVIPGTVTYSGTTYRVIWIQANAFLNATNITSVNVHYGVYFIYENAFRGCTGITTVRLPSTIDLIGENAFNGCTALKYVYLPKIKLMTSAKTTTFPSNSGMYLYLPKEITEIELNNFKNSSIWNKFSNINTSKYVYDKYMADGGMYIQINSANNEYPYLNISNPLGTDVELRLTGYNTSGSNTQSGTVYTCAGTNGRFSPSGEAYYYKVTSIGAYAFRDETTLKTITIPASVTSITDGDMFVNGASALENIYVASGNTAYGSYSGCLYSNTALTILRRVPEAKTTMSWSSTVSSIYYGAFRNSVMTSIRVPYGVKSIGAYAFQNTAKLDYVYIPSSVTSLNVTGVFKGTKSNNYIFCNMANPPTVVASNYFGTNSNMRLYVPYGKIDTYKNAGWTGFKSYNNQDVQAQDYNDTEAGYTVTSTAATTIDGTSYAGRVKVVCYQKASIADPTTINIPKSVTINGKNYAVTMIGEDAFNNHTTNFTVTGCENVDTIGAYAFQNQPITSYPFRHYRSRYIMNYAFDGAGLTGTVALPYGVQYIAYMSFANGKYSRIIVPSSVNSWNGTFCKNTTSLTELVWNKATSASLTTNFDLGTVPTYCQILVPTGVVNQYKANSGLSGRSNYITAGAYDFAYNNNYSGIYFLTITSTASTTYNGTTYAGKAKYVYHPNIKVATYTTSYGFDVSEEDKTVSGDSKKYLITEIGDSLLYGSKYTGGNLPATVTRIGQSAFRNCAYAQKDLSLPSVLTYIGHDAFYDSKITGELKVPASVTTIDDYGLCASTLTSIYFAGNKPATFGKSVWSQNISGNVWVPNAGASAYLTAANGWGTNYANKLAVWIKPTTETVTFSSVLPTNLAGSGLNAYYVSGYDRDNTGKEATLTKANQAPAETGLLLADLTTGKEYRISRPTTSVSAPMTNYLMPAINATNVYSQTVGYYWDSNNKKFVKPTGTYNTPATTAYLKVSSSESGSKSEIYTNLWPKQSTNYKKGDVNGDGDVDVTDINILINIMLGKDNANNYNGRANVNGEGGIDVSDINATINAMLGR